MLTVTSWGAIQRRTHAIERVLPGWPPSAESWAQPVSPPGKDAPPCQALPVKCGNDRNPLSCAAASSYSPVPYRHCVTRGGGGGGGTSITAASMNFTAAETSAALALR